MERKLIINPLTRIQFTDGQNTDFFLLTPKPGRGLQKLAIKRSEQANLHELFMDLSKLGYSYFDPENDIDEAEFRLLDESGVLIEPGEICEKPLFYCSLEDVEAAVAEGEASALIVNPSFRFEPFNFANIAPWANELHFSPHQATAWIKLPVSETEIGYWFDSEQAKIISNLSAGEKLDFQIEPEILRKLIAADILTTPETLAKKKRQQNDSIKKANEEFLQNKYAVLREILPAAQMKALRRFYRAYTANGFMPFDDHQSRRYYQHNEPLAGYFHQQFARLASLIIGEEAVPSYVYAATYIDQAELKPHLDRSQCKFSISFQVDYLPEQRNQLSPWGLFVAAPESIKDSQFPAAKPAADPNTAAYLASGDGLFYRGCELKHYRYPLADNHQSTSLFFHYVSRDFEGDLT